MFLAHLARRSNQYHLWSYGPLTPHIIKLNRWLNLTGVKVEVKEIICRTPAGPLVWVHILRNRRVPGAIRGSQKPVLHIVLNRPCIALTLIATVAGIIKLGQSSHRSGNRLRGRNGRLIPHRDGAVILHPLPALVAVSAGRTPRSRRRPAQSPVPGQRVCADDLLRPSRPSRCRQHVAQRRTLAPESA